MRYPTMIIGESRSETQSQREERFSLLAFGFSLRANRKTQSRFSPRSRASSFDDERINGLGRRLERHRSWRGQFQRDGVDRLFLNTNFSPLKPRQQCGHGLGVKALSREILNNAQGFHRIVRLLVRPIRSESVKGVRNRNYARQQRDLVAF